MTTIIFLVVLLLMLLAKLLIQGIFLIHRLQQLGYSNLKLVKWLEGKQYREMLLWNMFELLLPLLIILLLYYNIKQIPVYKYITSTLMFIVFSWKLIHPFISNWIGPKSNVKVPLVYTPRVKRLIFSLIIEIIVILYFIFEFTIIPLDSFTLSTWRFYRFNTFLLFISVITPVIVIIANLINKPFEEIVHLRYFYKARARIKKSDNVLKIGITGSYGKTSTKHFLATILNEKHKTLFTPASYNTPMGISKVINKNNLNDYEIFIAEMGADKSGDIKKLCKLVEPKYGIITAIDIQHLETFGSIKNIIETKLALFHNLKNKGFGIYNYDSEILRKSIKNVKFKIPLFSYSMNEDNFSNVSIIAKNIKHTREGLIFNAIFKDKLNINVKAEVLGRHNISNLLAVILMAKLIGLSRVEIENGIKKIMPVEHRLQKINSASGILILDDAFNANLYGACEALKVLREIDGNKKIIVTPGLIGLGEKEEEINEQFGSFVAKYSDIAILIGKERTKSIYKSLIEKEFKKDNIIVANSLEESKDVLKGLLKAGDIVLFENDLPDTYNE